MSNIEKYRQIFITTFGVAEKKVAKMKYQEVDTWDSVGHMNLIASIEDAFNIMLETDDILDFNSYAKGLEIVRKYGVEI